VRDSHVQFIEVIMKKTIAAAFAAILLGSTAQFSGLSPLLSTPAQAQAALTLENIAFKGDWGSVRIPKITVEGSSATKADIEALFDSKSLNTLGERLSRISARSISIPLIEFIQELPDATSSTTYKDTVLRDIRNGVITEAVTPSLATKAAAKAGKTFPGFSMEMANMAMKGVDLPLLLRFVYDKAAPGEQLKVATAEQTVGKTTYKLGDQASFSFESISMRDFKARPMQKPLMAIVADMQNNAANKTKETEKATILGMIDMVTAMSFGNMEIVGMTGEVKAPNEKVPVKFSMDRMSGAGGGDVNGRFSMQGLKMAFEKGNMTFGEYTIDGVDMSRLWESLRTMSAKPDFKPDEMDFGAFIPKIALIRLGGIDLNVPDPKAVGQMIKARLGLAEIKMSNHVGAIPADIAINLDKLQLDIPANTQEKGLKDILALGYKAIDVSMKYDQAWDQAKKVLSLKEYSVRSVGMLNARATAEIANVPADVFTTDKAKAAVAALGMAARSVTLTVVNEGLAEKLIAQQAKEQRKKPEDLRAELATGAAIMAPMLMGDHPGAKAIGAALGKFAADPKNVKVNLTAKGEGVGAMDFLAAANPMDVLKKVDITATANQ
jgi:hypothetical protein